MESPRDRDEGWFTSLYATRYAHIARYGQRRLIDADLADELAQEVFIIAWRRRAEVPEHSLPWLYGVARRLLANQWRSRRAAAQVLPITDPELLWHNASPGSDAGVAVADIHAALATLTDLDQEILRLVGWEELTTAEAAVVVGCTRTAAAVRLHRARKRLTAALSTPAAPSPRRPALTRPGKVL
jgi:RNA polymerase sigma-70 factor (ECF subfamily)